MLARYVRYFALVYGIVFLLVGIAGFVPGLVAPPQAGPALTVATGFGRLFDLFPVNVLHNIVHLAFGVWGLAAYRTFSAARLYAQSVAVIYGVLTVMGLIPLFNTTFGLIPLYGHDVWLHALLALVAAYFGWAPVRAEGAPVATTPTTTSAGARPQP
ncbi:MAG: DUF4383 domain-containing protein [Geminicoccaceae bacterium]